MSHFQKVATFIEEVRGHHVPNSPRAIDGGLKEDRIQFMGEELDEFVEADTLEDQVDALVDLHYFLLGTLYEMGVSEVQYDQCFDIVHNANMAKKAGVKSGRTTVTVDATKPEGWVPPTFKDVFDGS